MKQKQKLAVACARVRAQARARVCVRARARVSVCGGGPRSRRSAKPRWPKPHVAQLVQHLTAGYASPFFHATCGTRKAQQLNITLAVQKSSGARRCLRNTRPPLSTRWLVVPSGCNPA